VPDARLQRTRAADAGAKPDVPPCIRLGHLWFWQPAVDTWTCSRCRITVERYAAQNLAGEIDRRAAESVYAK